VEQRHVKTIEGAPTPDDIFQPHVTGVELFSDMDALFAGARRLSATGEYPVGSEGLPPEAAAELEKFKGQRSVVIVTPGRMLMPVPALPPGSMPREMEEGVRQLMPPDPPLVITAVSYTHLRALAADITKAIPFIRFLAAFASLGHTVTVFEGHPSAFESGVRGGDVLMVDSGVRPFLQKDWSEVAFRVMRTGARILLHERATHELSQMFPPGGGPVQIPPGKRAEVYADTLIRLLLIGERTSVQLTSREPLPALADFAAHPRSVEEVAALPIRHEELDADEVIDSILNAAGWHPFKSTGVLKVPMFTHDGKPLGMGVCGLKLSKVAGKRRQLLLER
jgi:hypothetical protein